MQSRARLETTVKAVCYDWRITVPLGGLAANGPLELSAAFPDSVEASCSCRFNPSTADAFSATWTAKTSLPSIPTHCVLNAELYWTKKSGTGGVLISWRVSEYRQKWPTDDCESFTLNAGRESVQRAEGESRGKFAWGTHLFFLLRLRFTSVAPLRSAPPEIADIGRATGAQDRFRLERVADG